jgi:hypothetical protein
MTESEVIYKTMDQSEKEAVAEIERIKDQAEDPRKANKIKNLRGQYTKVDEYFRKKEEENSK